MEEHDKAPIYCFTKGYVTVLGEFKSEKYTGGTACVIFNQEDVVSVTKEMLRFEEEQD